MKTLIALIAALTLTACATAHQAMSGPLTLTPAPGQPAPAQAQLYADCIAQAASGHTYDRESNWVRFHCSGATAQAFYDGLAAYSSSIHSEMQGNGRTYRFTQRLVSNPSGIDGCWRDDAGGSYGCTVVLNVGEFLAQ
jgi:hypothetical protein